MNNALRALLVAVGIALAATACWGESFESAPPAGADTSTEDTSQEPDVGAPHPTLLIGVDGFHPDYLDRASTPNLDRLARGGVASEGLIPVFPSVTFSNMYSLATGLYPENSGVVGNTMFDPQVGRWFTMSDADAVSDAYWYGGEPIWVTAEKQGLRTATMFWVGSEAPVGGVRPTRWAAYDGRIPYAERVDQVVEWLQIEDESRPGFVTLYLSSPDSAGHAHGPESVQVTEAIEKVDATIGDLIDELTDAGIWPDINVVIVSDHGMASLSEDKVVFLDDIIDLDDVQMINWTPVAMIDPRSGEARERVYAQLEASADHYSVYRREDLPERFRLKGHHRVPEIVVVADLSYTLTSREYYEQNGVGGGTHGYDPQLPEMHAFFLGHGPAFKEGHRVGSFAAVDVYELLCRLLGVEPAPNDGDPAATRDLMAADVEPLGR